ncbi:MAG: SAF domain-containing protein [Candidatus Dormiibacterota bacterium]
MRRWLTAALALAIGCGVSAALLIFTSPDRDKTEVYAAAHDVQSGAPLGPDAITLVKVNAGSARLVLFARGDQVKLEGLRATHELVSGQLIQRGDVSADDASTDRRLVFVPIKDSPSLVSGSKVDLLAVDVSADHVSVVPFALGVEVRAAVAGGLIVVVSSEQAPAFVYAANAMKLTAVIAEPGTGTGAEGAVSAEDQAMAVATQR